MLLSLTAFILKTVIVAWFSASVSDLLPTTDISWRWLDAVMTDVGLLEPNPTSKEISDVFIQGVAIVTEPSASQLINPVTVLTAASPANEADDMDVHAEDTPPRGIIWQLLEPTVAVVKVTPAATTPVDDALTLISVHPQPTWFPASLTRVGSRLWSSSFAGSITPVSLFTAIIALLVAFAMGLFARSVSVSAGWENLPTLVVEVCGPSETVTSCSIDSLVSSAVEADSEGQIRQGEVVVDNIPVSEQAEHGGNLEATDNTASIPSGDIPFSGAVRPLRTSVGVQSTSDVREVKDASVSCEPVSRTSVGIQCSMAIGERTDKFVPSESRSSLYAIATEGNSPSQVMDNSDVFSVPTVNSQFNIYTMAETISFPSVDDLANVTEFERLRQDVRGFSYEPEVHESMAPSLPATELGVSPSPSTSTPASPRPVRAKPFEYFRERWGADTKHVWGREFWYRMLRNEELIKIAYDTMFPLDEGATDEDKYEMELGEGLVRISALRLSEHATNPILRLPYNAPTENADHNDSLFVSAEANQTAVSSAASIGIRSPSPFVRPSNPQSRFLESSSEASVAAPTIRMGLASPSRAPAARRRRPALAQITNTPRGVLTTPSRTPVKAGRVQGVLHGVPTPPTSVLPKLAKHGSRFPLIAPATRIKDESDSPTRPARHCPPPPSKFPRWRG